MILLMFQLRSQTKNNYLLKRKNQKTAGWILLGAGVTLSLIDIYELFYGLTEIGNGQHHKKMSMSFFPQQMPLLIRHNFSLYSYSFS